MLARNTIYKKIGLMLVLLGPNPAFTQPKNPIHYQGDFAKYFSLPSGRYMLYTYQPASPVGADADTAWYLVYRPGHSQALIRAIAAIKRKATNRLVQTATLAIERKRLQLQTLDTIDLFARVTEYQPIPTGFKAIEKGLQAVLPSPNTILLATVDYNANDVIDTRPPSFEEMNSLPYAADDKVPSTMAGGCALHPDVVAAFPGGSTAMYAYIGRNVVYPAHALENEVQGQVLARIIIGKDGSIDDVVIECGLGHGCDNEVLRVLKKMPRWKPGRKNGKAIRSAIRLPITFQLPG